MTLIKRNADQSILDYFVTVPEKDTFTENYLLFLKELGTEVRAEIAPTQDIFPSFPHNILLKVCEIGWQCHHTVPYLAQTNENILPFFGFADDYADNRYRYTFCHSFLLSPCGTKLYDVQNEFYLEDLAVLKRRVRNYYGVYIPHVIINEMIAAVPPTVYANLAHFIKDEFLISKEKTHKLIDRIQHLKILLS